MLRIALALPAYLIFDRAALPLERDDTGLQRGANSSDGKQVTGSEREGRAGRLVMSESEGEGEGEREIGRESFCGRRTWRSARRGRPR